VRPLVEVSLLLEGHSVEGDVRVVLSPQDDCNLSSPPHAQSGGHVLERDSLKAASESVEASM
jgi:hypothetical protein